MTESAQFAVIGMAVMGRNLAMNIADHGFRVAVYNRSTEVMEEAVAASNGQLLGASTLEELVSSLERPRRIMLMIKAGPAVDRVIEQLLPLLEKGDIVIDGGNSWFEDTERRERQLRDQGLCFFGVGVSGGEEGARHGPSIMPGGTPDAYPQIQPVLEAIAARTDSGACVTLVGAGGAGHFVKMVHNGIEYADMQLIAEAYDLLRRLQRLEVPRVAEIFARWNQGLLESFLIELTSQVLRVRDQRGDSWLIDQVLDKAGQKGTGRWTAKVALDLGVPVPAIAAAIDARVLSSMKTARQTAARVLPGPSPEESPAPGAEDSLVDSVRDALYASKICAYAQGVALIRAGAEEFGWKVDLREIGRIWKGGCIIRARFLDTMMQAYRQNPELPNLLLDPRMHDWLEQAQDSWRGLLARGQSAGIPMPAMSASLAYYDSYRSADLPQNLTQAQRDAFGAHTYQRRDDPEGPFVHTEWLA